MDKQENVVMSREELGQGGCNCPMPPQEKRMVLGFCFSSTSPARVALIRKKKPKWQEGQWNGIGGKVEHGETPTQAMVREFREETGVDLPDAYWSIRAYMDGGSEWCVTVFTAETDLVCDVRTMETEPVALFEVAALPHEVIPNLRWLIPLIRDSEIGATTIPYPQIAGAGDAVPEGG